MHYKNGRAAKAGDRVVSVSPTNPAHGILHTLQPGNTSCNARVAQTSPSDPYVSIGECLHIDDIANAAVPNSTPSPTP